MVRNMNFFLEPIIQIQENNCFNIYSFDCCLNGISKESVALTFEKQNKKVNLIYSIQIFHVRVVKIQ